MKYKVEVPSIIGYVDVFDIKNDLIQVDGWAVDMEEKSPCQVIFLKNNSYPVESREINSVARPDVVKYLNSTSCLHCGFSLVFKNRGYESIEIWAANKSRMNRLIINIG